MKYCSKCGKEMIDEAIVCTNCGCSCSELKEKPEEHDIPKCTCCGNIAPWKKGPVLRGIDFIIGLVLLLLGVVPGIIYLLVVGIVRSNEKNREKICRKCGARNLFTYIY